MITILKNTENGLEIIEDFINNCWINVVDPAPSEVERLVQLGIPSDFITYPLDLDERARIEREDDGKILIILRVPYYQGAAVDIPFTTIPVGIILTNQNIVTVCRNDIDVIQEFVNGQVRSLSTAKRNRFVLRILLRTAGKFLANLREINKRVDLLEDQLQLSQKNKEVLELLKYQKSLVYFTTALRSNELMLERLRRGQLFHIYPDDEDLLEDVITENQQAIEMTNISSDILASTMDAFASIVSNNLNVVMKVLTSITIVLNLPVAITSFFGMNVTIPFFGDSDYAYLATILLCLMSSGMAVFIFSRKNWL